MVKMEFCKIKLVREKSREYNDLDFLINSNTSAFRFLTRSPINIHESDVECIYCIYLNTQNKVNATHLVAQGSLTECSIEVRDIIKGAILHNANSIILAHNHPGESCQASQADICFTERAKEACNIFNIKILDHIIVCNDSDYYSFAKEGLL